MPASPARKTCISCRSSAHCSPGSASRRRRAKTATEDTYYSMALSRGASALGVALALGEIKAAPEAAICSDWSLYSSVASTSAGVELLRNEIVVLGNAVGWAGDLLIGHE